MSIGHWTLSNACCGNFGHFGRFKIESSFFWQLLALATMVLFLATVVLFLATVLLFGNFHVSASLLPLYYTADLCVDSQLVWDVVRCSAVVNWRGSGRRGENYQNKFTLVVRRRAVKVIEAGQGHSQVEWTEIWERFWSPAKWVCERLRPKAE